MCCLSFCSPWQLIQENCNDLQLCTAFMRFKEREVNPSKLGVILKKKRNCPDKMPVSSGQHKWGLPAVWMPSSMPVTLQLIKSQILTPFLAWSGDLFPLVLLQFQTEGLHPPMGEQWLSPASPFPCHSEGLCYWNWPHWTSWNTSGPAECWSERNLQPAWENPAMWGSSISCECSQTEQHSDLTTNKGSPVEIYQ